MKTPSNNIKFAAALCAFSAASCLAADENSVYLGAATIRFNVDSSDVSGPAGTTPPGVRIGVENRSTAAMVYTRRIDTDWSVSFLMGVPPMLRFKGDGTAAALGEVGTARAWFPALTLDYWFGSLGPVRPFVGAGLNYTKFTKAQVNSTFTTAFGGTASSTQLKSSVGPVFRLGVEFPLSEHLVLQASAARYLIKTDAEVTTQTPGLGPITRSATLRSDPDVFALLLGYRF